MNTRHLQAADLRGRRWRGLVRESTAAQAEKWSPERQRDDLRRAADELGLVPAEPLFYERVGSGEAVGAPELEQALADAGQYDVLVVAATSRFARNRAEAVRLKAAFKRAGVVIYFADARLISGTYAGGLTEGIREVMDEAENETRRFWIAGGQRQRQLAGRWTGAIPFGLRKVMVDRPDGSRGWDGSLEPDPETAPTVVRIFEARANGSSARAIARAHGLPPRTVDRILVNPVYIGQMIRYRTEREDRYYDRDREDGLADLGQRFPPVVSVALFARVGAKVAR